MVCFLGRPDEETGLLRAASPTRVQGQLPGRWVGILFLREPVCRFDIIVLPFFFRRSEPFGRLHRTNHHRSLVFFRRSGTQVSTLFCGVS